MWNSRKISFIVFKRLRAGQNFKQGWANFRARGAGHTMSSPENTPDAPVLGPGEATGASNGYRQAISVSVFGLGKLGGCMAACFAAKGLRVIGVDVDTRVVESFQAGSAPFFEPSLDETLRAGRDRFSATTDARKAVQQTDVTFIVVPTPSTSEGGFSLEYVLAAAHQVGEALREKNGYHLIVLTSTVLPMACESEVIPAIEAASGKRVGAGFGFCYNPEFIALGSVVRDFLKPDFLLIGESDTAAGDLLEKSLLATVEDRPPVERMSLSNAEVTKIAINTFLTAKIAFANSLAEICERIPGGDVDAVTRAMGLDSRISPKYFRGGMPYGGPCFPRDSRALAFAMTQLGLEPALAQGVDAANTVHLEEIVLRVGSIADGPVAVLGLAFKPGTAVLDASPGLAVATALMAEGLEVRCFDPLASFIDESQLPGGSRLTSDLSLAVQSADVIVVANADASLLDAVSLETIRHSGARVLLDCWRLFADARDSLAPVKYLAIGLNAAQASVPSGVADR